MNSIRYGKGLRHLFCLLITTMPLLYGCDSFSMEKDKSNGDLDAFWKAFREAVVKKDYKALASMTKFPLKNRGEDDSDPVIERDEKWFLKNISKILAAPHGLGLEPESLEALIKKKAGITKEDTMGANEFYVGPLYFSKDKEWKLVECLGYFDE